MMYVRRGVAHAAMALQALRRAGVRDPMLLLDEIDKMGADSARGDPAAALLEVCGLSAVVAHDYTVSTTYILCASAEGPCGSRVCSV